MIVQDSQLANAIDCKGHKVSSCNPYGGSKGLCDLQAITWLKLVNLHWIVYDRQIHVELVIREVIRVVNIVFKNLISWLVTQNMEVVMMEFKD